MCTGRSSRSGDSRIVSDYPRPETIEETAELVDALGGIGVAVQVDHLDPEQVSRLADRLRSDYGRIDLLVNDIWGGELLKGAPATWNTPLWRQDLDAGLRLLHLAVDTHLITAHFLSPLLIGHPGGLIVEITDGTAEFNAATYRISVFYDLAKASINRLAFSQGHELADHRAAAVAVTPGWLRSEMMLDAYGVTEDDWRAALTVRPGYPTAPPGFAYSESPRYVGRGIAALAADPERDRWNQRSLSSAALADAYGITDIDGTRPDSWAGRRD
ncbi:Short-chain dehydrogenase/reductase SDR OS=Tsukamurella paurometabola (strain ATCC 8368 / DSM/ CCUG 35730 / CIP 100753 / JCM 10117 / KCTC 9821 / NBRC 16120/ NCIMB 702349 / NCTC 13040) OX=521096 GN=Tpau_1937 PE=4 SV=1 [Tsukamurella paurometabola]|nr:short chain dehydrogenase [Tsukamurella paurometabola]